MVRAEEVPAVEEFATDYINFEDKFSFEMSDHGIDLTTSSGPARPRIDKDPIHITTWR